MHRIDQPQPGYYRTRLSKGGCLVPVKIWLEGDAALALVNGAYHDALEIWPYCAGDPVSRETYVRMEHTRIWAERHQPWHPAANPYRPINVNDIMENLK